MPLAGAGVRSTGNGALMTCSIVKCAEDCWRAAVGRAVERWAGAALSSAARWLAGAALGRAALLCAGAADTMQVAQAKNRTAERSRFICASPEECVSSRKMKRDGTPLAQTMASGCSDVAVSEFWVLVMRSSTQSRELGSRKSTVES